MIIRMFSIIEKYKADIYFSSTPLSSLCQNWQTINSIDYFDVTLRVKNAG